MKTKIILLCCTAVIFAAGCTSQNKREQANLIGPDSIKAEALATYYNGVAYFTRQQHFYDTDSMKLKVKASEPSGAYEMTYSGSSISLSNDNAKKFWNAQMAELLTYAFSLSGKYATPESLKFEKSDSVVRIQGILYNVYVKDGITLFARTSDAVIDRLQITGKDGSILSAFCYNSFYEAAINKVIAHNIDIYTGKATGIDTKLIYSVKYTNF